MDIYVLRTTMAQRKALEEAQRHATQDYEFKYGRPSKGEEDTVALDPANFVPRKGILTRYGKKILKEGSRYYGHATLTTAIASSLDNLPQMEEILDHNDRPVPQNEVTLIEED